MLHDWHGNVSSLESGPAVRSVGIAALQLVVNAVTWTLPLTTVHLNMLMYVSSAVPGQRSRATALLLLESCGKVDMMIMRDIRVRISAVR